MPYRTDLTQPGRPGRPRGTSKYPYVPQQEEAQVVAYIQGGLDNAAIASRMGWADPTIVRDIRAKYYPTTGLATAILQAGAARLAERIVEDATVDEALDVLSRPNVGVLKPLVKGEGKAAFLTSVQVESLGGVRVSTAYVTGEGAEEYGVPVPVPVPPAPPALPALVVEAAPVPVPPRATATPQPKSVRRTRTRTAPSPSRGPRR